MDRDEMEVLGILKSANMFVVTKKIRSVAGGESVTGGGESSSDESDDDDLDDDDETIEEEDEEVRTILNPKYILSEDIIVVWILQIEWLLYRIIML